MTEQHGLRIGVLGTGWGTRISVPALRAEGWQVAALWSRNAERAEKQAAELEIPFATNDAAALVNRPDIDAVTVVTPTPTHRDICLQALAAGKHLLAEKPMARNAGDAREMAAAAESAGVTAMINFEFRFTPADAARAASAGGRLRGAPAARRSGVVLCPALGRARVELAQPDGHGRRHAK